MSLRIITHSGSFHPDDVFAAATLELVLETENLELVRTRDEVLISQGDYVFDVGGIYDESKNRFDHHQKGGAGKRPDGVPFASFGLVWKKFGDKIAGPKEIANLFDHDFVRYIDIMDNGDGELKPVFGDVYPYTLAGVIFSFLPTWKSEGEEMDQGFRKAVNFAKDLIVREIQILKDEEEGKLLVVKAYQESADKRLVIFDQKLPWAEVLAKYPEPLFIIEPISEDHTISSWKVRAVRDNIFSFKNRKDLPLAWAGKSGKDLAEITGVTDATFCHNALFIAVAKSKDGALELARLALSL
ncbi:MAG: MYG1 family protein [Candidatus Paceibacterota bacterium]|jgi:uncharacterized UPF0160 family protein